MYNIVLLECVRNQLKVGKKVYPSRDVDSGLRITNTKQGLCHALYPNGGVTQGEIRP